MVAGATAGARRARRLGVMAVAAVSCAGLAAGLGAAAAAAASASRGSVARPAGSGGRLWVSTYQGPGSADSALAVAVSPDGGTVFVTGESEGEQTLGHLDYATVAYSAATGAQLWVSRYNGPANGQDTARSIAVSPDGSAVFVTGASDGGASGDDYATVAYAAATGAQLWVSRYNGPGNGFDAASAVAVSPGGGTVFVTGGSQSGAKSSDYATVAYDAATGAQRWVRRYHGPRGKNFATSIAVSPSGGRVFVTGGSAGRASKDYATIAYDASTGARVWVRRYNGPASGWDFARSVAVSPDGRSVFVTGQSEGIGTGFDYATVAYRAATGRQLRVSRYNGRADKTDDALQVTAGPGGHRIFVTGTSQGKTSGQDYATIAYNAATGAWLWASRYNDRASRNDLARGLAVSPSGHTVYVTGVSEVAGGPAAATVAYNAATGAQLWARLYTFGGNSAVPYGIAASPRGGAVYVTGGSSANVYITIAYQAGPVPAG